MYIYVYTTSTQKQYAQTVLLTQGNVYIHIPMKPTMCAMLVGSATLQTMEVEQYTQTQIPFGTARRLASPSIETPGFPRPTTSGLFSRWSGMG